MSSNWFKKTQKKQVEEQRRKGMYFWQQQQKKKEMTLPHRGICMLHSYMMREVKQIRKELTQCNQQMVKFRSELEKLAEAFQNLKLVVEHDYVPRTELERL
jgi:hypothetical protein